jgi:hypothetical protein
VFSSIIAIRLDGSDDRRFLGEASQPPATIGRIVQSIGYPTNCADASTSPIKPRRRGSCDLRADVRGHETVDQSS